MRIEFPCPISLKDLSVHKGTLYCPDCCKEIVDLRNFKGDTKNFKGSCVVAYQDELAVGQYSFVKKFALAILLVFASSGFNFSSAQMENGVKKISKDLLKDNAFSSSVGLFELEVDHRGSQVNVDIVYAVLPNGREIHLRNVDVGAYTLEIPNFCMTKEILVYVKTEFEVIKLSFTLNEFNEDKFYHLKLRKPPKKFRSIIVGSF